jgi:hypothetical protein
VKELKLDRYRHVNILVYYCQVVAKKIFDKNSLKFAAPQDIRKNRNPPLGADCGIR